MRPPKESSVHMLVPTNTTAYEKLKPTKMTGNGCNATVVQSTNLKMPIRS
jgi:hypothetical protein